MPTNPKTLLTKILATKESQTSLSYSFKIRKTIVRGIVEEVCEAIWKHTLNAVPSNYNYLSHLVRPSLASKQLSIYLYFSCVMLI